MSARPALAATLMLMLAACTSGGDNDAASADVKTVSCDYPKGIDPPAREVDPPSADAPSEGDTAATVMLNGKEVELTLAVDTAPCTVHSFVSLAEQGYFDDTPCPRITTDGIFVLQCGDPTGTRTGGPGYTIPDEYTGSETYPAGTLAMANTGQPNTGGSQFFIVYDGPENQLAPDYTVFGEIDAAGLEVVRAISEGGTTNGLPDGPPKNPATIESVTVD